MKRIVRIEFQKKNKKWFLEWPELTNRRNGNSPSCVECYEAIFRCVKHLCLMSPETDFSPSLINYSRHRLAKMRERCDSNWQKNTENDRNRSIQSFRNWVTKSCEYEFVSECELSQPKNGIRRWKCFADMHRLIWRLFQKRFMWWWWWKSACWIICSHGEDCCFHLKLNR